MSGRSDEGVGAEGGAAKGDSAAPVRWLALTVRIHGAADVGVVLDRLMAFGATGVEERDEGFLTYLRPSHAPEARVAEIRDALTAEVGDGGSVEVTWRWQPHEEWSETWRRGLAPRRIGRRLLVSPSWADPDPGPADLLIRIDPGMAFGTAEHETTRGCMELLEQVVGAGDRIVDAGAGTGILSISAALLGAGEVVAVEFDDFATGAARENVEINRVGDRVRVLHRALDASGLAALGPVDGIVANIRSRILMELLPGARKALRPGGWLILGGVLSRDREGILLRAKNVGLVPDGEVLGAAWWTGRFRAGPDVHPRASSRP